MFEADDILDMSLGGGNTQSSALDENTKKGNEDNDILHRCPVCSYATNRKDNLQKHLLIHTNKRPHKCSICGKGFKDKSNMITHQKNVHSEKKYECQVCHKFLSTKNSLKEHMYLHRPDDKPFKCMKCNFSCVRKIKLLQHIAFKHDNNSNFFCIICKKQFGTKHQVDTHIKKHVKDHEKIEKLKVEVEKLKNRVKRLLNKKSSTNGHSKKRKMLENDNHGVIGSSVDNTKKHKKDLLKGRSSAV